MKITITCEDKYEAQKASQSNIHQRMEMRHSSQEF